MTKIDTSNCHYAEAIMAALVADGENVKSARLIRADGNEEEQLIVLELAYDDVELDVSFYVYSDGSWFSPYDWHGWQPQYKSEAKDCEWQLGVTGRKAVILGGAPRMIFGE